MLALTKAKARKKNTRSILIENRRGVDQNRVQDTRLQARVCDLWAGVGAQETGTVRDVLAVEMDFDD